MVSNPKKAPKKTYSNGSIKKVDKEYKIGEQFVRFSYRDVVYDDDDWADASRFLPADYDMMSLKLDTGRKIPGWIQGNQWEALRLKPGNQVLFWKRTMPDNDPPKKWIM